jgi:hypothetical protein
MIKSLVIRDYIVPYISLEERLLRMRIRRKKMIMMVVRIDEDND